MIRSKISAALFAALVAFAALSFSAPASAQFADQKQYAPTSGGTANAQTIAIPNMPATVPQGVPFWFKPGASNSTSATLKIGNATALPLAKPSPSGPVALSGGELQIGQMTQVQSDGTNLVITSSINSTAASIYVTPQGYLTPCSQTIAVTGCPTIGTVSTAGGLTPTGDVTSATTLYYQTTAGGNQIPIWNGTQMVVFQFSELTLTLGSSNLANTLYDVCVTTTTAGAYAVNGTPTLVTSVAWTTSTAGSGNRGTGASTAQIGRTTGVWTNSVQIDGKNGATTYTAIPANRCTIVATLLVDGTNGQATFHRTIGQSRRWALWNFYNRLPQYLKVTDPTGSPWSYTTATVRPSNNATANSLSFLTGLPEEVATFTFDQRIQVSSTNGQSSTVQTGICVNVTNAFTGKSGYASMVSSNTGPVVPNYDTKAIYEAPPLLGLQTITSCEAGFAASTVSIYGTEPFMALIAQWRG